MASGVAEGRHTVLDQLNELFGNVLNMEVIESVALSYQYDVQKTSNKLIELSSTREKNMTWGQKLSQNNPTPIKQCVSTGAISKPKSRKLQEIEKTVEDIRKGYRVLVLLRGLPGSGKSYLAKQILQQSVGPSALNNVHILSTDDFFVQRGMYNFDASKLSEAHGWNHTRAFQSVSQGFSPIIIDNTNTQMWEMKPYATMAIDYGYIIRILEPDNHWSFNEKELTKRNVHGVPRQKIRDMLERYDKNVTPEKLLSAYSLRYTNLRPPQFRTYPLFVKLPMDNKKTKQTISKSQSASAINNSVYQDKGEVGEMINLMEFNDLSPTGSKDVNSVDNSVKTNGNPLDEKILWNGSIGDILKPSTTLHSEVVVIDSDDDDGKNKNGKSVLGADLENAWGISESALRSWDIVTPLSDESEIVQHSTGDGDEVQVERMDVGCGTQDSIDDDDCVVVRNAFGRDINIGTPKHTSYSIPKKTMRDQSCFTEDLENEEEHIRQLKIMFPTIPEKNLLYLYKNCKGNFDWTIDLLLENKDDLEVFFEQEVNVDEEEPMEVVPPPEPSPPSTSEDPKPSQKRKFVQSKELKTHLFTSPKFLIGKNKKEQAKVEKTPSNSASSHDSDSDLEFDDCGLIDTVELNLGDVIVEQLENKFGDPNLKYPKGFQPLVQVPIDLARQLYTLYIESVYQQMDAQTEVLETLVREDAELAKKLHEEEELKLKVEEDRKNLCGQWKNLTPETLADKLTKQKLFETFPSINQNVLIEIYSAHNNVYQDTIDTLLASAGNEMTIKGTPAKIKEPPVNEEEYKEWEEAHRSSEAHQIEDERRDAKSYREEANKYLQKRHNLHQKAQSYYQRGMIEVAQFYSELASKQTKFFDTANHLAAQTFLNEHSERLADFNTLDLHYLYVKEAIPALDVFLDRNINLLQGGEKQSEMLHIITGRGNRSMNHVSRIKPVVIARLKKRRIRYNILNPGLLRVKVTKSSPTTSMVDS